MDGFGYYCSNKTELTEDSYRVLIVCPKYATEKNKCIQFLDKTDGSFLSFTPLNP